MLDRWADTRARLRQDMQLLL